MRLSVRLKILPVDLFSVLVTQGREMPSTTVFDSLLWLQIGIRILAMPASVPVQTKGASEKSLKKMSNHADLKILINGLR